MLLWLLDWTHCVQMAIAVDAYAVEDPFFGHGLMAKGKLLQFKGQLADALDHFKLALQAFRYISFLTLFTGNTDFVASDVFTSIQG